MAILITAAEVREVCPTTQTDASIDLLVSSVGCKLDACLETAYVDCPDLAKQIKLLTVCHFLFMQGNPGGSVKSYRQPNGASASYGDWVSGGTGLNASGFGQQILMLDDAKCVIKAFSNPRVFVATAGTSGSYCSAYAVPRDRR